jgi:HAD superfamily hydrolase (TIGR01549 family)
MPSPAAPASGGRPFEAIIFDLGNTLIYFDAYWPAVMSEAIAALFDSLRAAGLNLEREAFLSDFRRRLELYYQERDTEFIEYTTLYVLRDLLAQSGRAMVPDSVLRTALGAMYGVTQAYWKVVDDAHATLRSLGTQGYHLGMISNAADDQDVQVLVDQAALRPYFDFILTSAAEGIRKPNPLIFRTALARWDLPPERAAMVGDMLGADILGARNAGIFSVWVTRHADSAANRAHEDTIVPDVTIAALNELPPLLASLKLRK